MPYKCLPTTASNKLFLLGATTYKEHEIINTYWLGMRKIALLLSPKYHLLSEATPKTIVGTEGTIKMLLP